MVKLALLLFDKELPSRKHFSCGTPADISVCSAWSPGSSKARPEARRGTLLIAQIIKPSGSEIGGPVHAINTNISEQIQSSYLDLTDPEQTNKQKNKELEVRMQGKLCLT